VRLSLSCFRPLRGDLDDLDGDGMVLAIEDYNLISSPDIQAGLILW
jgi:hypothetical protein